MQHSMRPTGDFMKIIFTMCLHLALLNSSVLAGVAEIEEMEIYEENESIFLTNESNYNVYGFISKALQFNSFEKNNVSGVKSKIMTSNVKAFDPFNNVSYTHVLLGEVYKNKNPFKRKYTHYRHVTVYDIEKETERVAYLPTHDEDCHDNSPFMAEWSESKTLTVSLDSKVGAEGLGLSASVGMSISQGVTYSTSRRIKGVQNVVATHTPMKISETYRGVTYIMGYNSKTKKHFALKAPNRFQSYPYDFQLTNQNLGFRVERKVHEYCEGYRKNDSTKNADPFSPKF